MEAAQLNIDTFAIVCESLTDVSDLLSCVLACSAIRPVATKCLLSMRPVRLRGDASIPPFHRFLFANAPAHAPHVRALDIDFPPNPDQISLLLEIFATCLRVKCISVFSPCCWGDRDVFVKITTDLHSYTSNMHVLRAILAVKSLRSLSLYITPPSSHSESYGIYFLKRILSHLDLPLRAFRAGQYLGQWDPETLEHLSCLAPTLEELELGCLMLGAAISFNASPFPSISTLTTYPLVRSLTVSTFSELPRVEHLQHLFPALDRALCFGRPNFVQELDENVAEIRAINQRAQRPATGGGRPSPRAWNGLDRVECNASIFYALGLRCPIRLALLRNVTSRTLHYTMEALRENPVSRLKLELELKPASDLGKFAQLFAQEFAENVTHLTLFLNFAYGRIPIFGDEDPGPVRFQEFQWDEIRVQWDGLLCEVPPLLHPLRKLTHLYIMIHASVYHSSPYPRALDSLTPFNPDGAMDFEGAAISLVSQFPSLQYLFFLTSWNRAKRQEFDIMTDPWEVLERWHMRRSYRIVGPGVDGRGMHEVSEERFPVELHPDDDVVQTILRKEDLGRASKVDQANDIFALRTGSKV